MHRWQWLKWLLLLAWATLWLVQVTAPADFWAGGQSLQAWHMQDMAFNGNSACQTTQNGVLCVEPPLYPWLATVCSLPYHRPILFGLQLPGMLAFLGCVLMLWFVGRWRFGVWSGFFAALFLLLSPVGLQGVLSACKDSLYMLLVAGAVVVVFRAWQDGGFWSWFLFWLLATAAMLTGGVMGLLPVAVLGVGAWLKHRKTAKQAASAGAELLVSVTGVAAPPFRGAWIPGLLLFLAVCGDWLFGMMALDEGLAMHRLTVEGILHGTPAAVAYDPVWMAIGRQAASLMVGFDPWCLLALVGVWAAFRRPAVVEGERPFEKFLAWYLIFGVLLFLMTPHVPVNWAVALVVPAALLAGREAARWLTGRKLSPRGILTWAAVLWGAFLLCTVAQFHFLKRNDVKVVQTRALQKMAAEFEKKVGRGKQAVQYAEDAPPAFQFYLGTMCRTVPTARVVAGLAGTIPMVAVVGDVEAVRAKVEAAGGFCREVVMWPEVREVAGKNGGPPQKIVLMGILTNQPEEKPGRGNAWRTE